MLEEGRDITEFYSAFGSHRETPLRHRNSNRLRKLNRQLENPHQNLSVVRSLFQILHFSFLRIPCDSYFSKCFVGTGDAGFSGFKGYTERERKTRWTQPGSICIGWQMTIIKNSEHARVTCWVVRMMDGRPVWTGSDTSNKMNKSVISIYFSMWEREWLLTLSWTLIGCLMSELSNAIMTNRFKKAFDKKKKKENVCPSASVSWVMTLKKSNKSLQCQCSLYL